MYSKGRKNRQVNSPAEKPDSWDGAISFAKAKIRELKRAIEGFKMAKKRGDQWPGESATQN